VQAQGRQPGADLRRRYAPGYLLDRPQPQRLKRLVVELAAVVLPHFSMVSRHGPAIKLLTIPLVTTLPTPWIATQELAPVITACRPSRSTECRP